MSARHAAPRHRLSQKRLALDINYATLSRTPPRDAMAADVATRIEEVQASLFNQLWNSTWSASAHAREMAWMMCEDAATQMVSAGDSFHEVIQAHQRLAVEQIDTVTQKALQAAEAKDRLIRSWMGLADMWTRQARKAVQKIIDKERQLILDEAKRQVERVAQESKNVNQKALSDLRAYLVKIEGRLKGCLDPWEMAALIKSVDAQVESELARCAKSFGSFEG
jgi:hypothetical protein